MKTFFATISGLTMGIAIFWFLANTAAVWQAIKPDPTPPPVTTSNRTPFRTPTPEPMPMAMAGMSNLVIVGLWGPPIMLFAFGVLNWIAYCVTGLYNDQPKVIRLGDHASAASRLAQIQ